MEAPIHGLLAALIGAFGSILHRLIKAKCITLWIFCSSNELGGIRNTLHSESQLKKK